MGTTHGDLAADDEAPLVVLATHPVDEAEQAVLAAAGCFSKDDPTASRAVARFGCILRLRYFRSCGTRVRAATGSMIRVALS